MTMHLLRPCHFLIFNNILSLVLSCTIILILLEDGFIDVLVFTSESDCR